jgi:hypothetical protein
LTRKVRFEGECDFHLTTFMNSNSMEIVFLAPRGMTISVTDEDFQRLSDSGQIGIKALRDLGPVP